MKKWIQALLSVLVIATMTVGMLAGLTRLTGRKYGASKNDAFYAQEEDFDVLLFGTSHMVETVFPMELWRDYGIVSYNLGSNTARLPLTYWILQGALEHTSPRLVVVDCYGLSGNIKGAGVYSMYHDGLDFFRPGLTQIRAVLDTRADDVGRLECLWDFALFHNRWTELSKNDFVPAVSPEKGAESQMNVTSISAAEMPPVIDSPQMSAEDTAGVEYLHRIIQTCRQQGIEVLLTYMCCGTSETEAAQQEANRAAAIAEEYDIGFVNLLHSDVVDLRTDMRDRSHVNPSGARKVTELLGQYITEHYDIPDRREDPAYAGWYEDYEDYTAFKIESLAAPEVVYQYENGKTYEINFRNYLMLLHDRRLSFCVFLDGNRLWRENEAYTCLLANAWIEPEKLPPDEPVLAVVDNLSGNVSYLTAGEAADTGFGRVTFTLSEGSYAVQIDGESAMELLPEADAGAVVIDNDSGAVATSSQFAVGAQTVGKIN